MTIEAEESVMPLLKELLEHFKGVSKVSILEDNPYNPEFVAKIMRSKKDFEAGRFTAIKTEDLWK